MEETVTAVGGEQGVTGVLVTTLAELDAAASAVEVIDYLLRHATEFGASDIHVDPAECGLEVRMRTHGTLVPLGVLPAELASTMVGRLKTMAEMQAYKRDVPQEGCIQPEVSGLKGWVRVTTYPTVHGERISLRLDSAGGTHRSLETLGHSSAVRDSLARAFEAPHGVVLVAGPAGSGKTTTLYSCIRHVVAQPVMRTIVTIEDPVERRVPGATQTQINPTSGLTFARALRSVLRQDPDVILVGEIRDLETARIALEAGLTGHLVASTVHAGSAMQVFPRLLDLGIEPFALTASVTGVAAQRLLRRRCTDCDGADSPVICLNCQGSGFAGSCLVSEWLPMSRRIRELINARADSYAIEAAARAAGFRSMHEHAARLVADGTTTLHEVRRVLGES